MDVNPYEPPLCPSKHSPSVAAWRVACWFCCGCFGACAACCSISIMAALLASDVETLAYSAGGLLGSSVLAALLNVD